MASINFLFPFQTAPLRSTHKPNMKSFVSPGATRLQNVFEYSCPAVRSGSATAAAAAATTMVNEQPEDRAIVRRSGNYEPSIWDFDSIQSLHNRFAEEKYIRRTNELKEQVKMMLQVAEDMELLDFLELIDKLERLGLAYHFEDQIHSILTSMHNDNVRNCGFQRSKESDLYASALEFRVFRQIGFHFPQDIFNSFINNDGEFDDSLSKDAKGMLGLCEACFLSLEGETILDLAREFTTRHLKNMLNNEDIENNLRPLVQHALELPLWWRVPRIEARWYIDVYETSPNMNPILLELAKLDFNIVQATHQQDLKRVARWWKDIHIAEKLPVIRDRVVENFFWPLGSVFEPQYSTGRIMVAKVYVLATMIDDIYDIYGTLEELELFTDAIDRWDVKAMDELPEYMRICFLGLFNSINEIAYDVLNKEQGAHVMGYLKKVQSIYIYKRRDGTAMDTHQPLMNTLATHGFPLLSLLILMHVYAGIANPINVEAMDCLDTHNIVRWSSLLLRLADDLGTSLDEMKRGDVPKILECYMKENGGSMEEAKEYVWHLLRETWKKMMNKDYMADSPFSRTFVRAAKNTGRVALMMYQYGDGHGINSNPVAKDCILMSLFTPIPLAN